MTASPLLYERTGPVATITLNAPQRRNALTPEMLCRLCDAFQAFSADASLRVAIVTGAGDLAFCAGGDLGRTIPLLTGERQAEDDWDRRLLGDPQVLAVSMLRDYPLHKPVVAAINGSCMAAGFELMLGTDVRLAATQAVFALPEVKRGVVPFAGSMVRLPRQIAHSAAMEIMLTGEPFTAAEAHRIGLVNRTVPARRLMAEARAIAERIAENGPLAVHAVKRTVAATSGLPLAEAWPVEDEAWRTVLATEDAREGPRAFMERRVAVFRGC